MPVCAGGDAPLDPDSNGYDGPHPYHCGVCGSVFGWLLLTRVVPAWYLHQLEDWLKSFLLFECLVRYCDPDRWCCGPCGRSSCRCLASWVCGLGEEDRLGAGPSGASGAGVGASGCDPSSLKGKRSAAKKGNSASALPDVREEEEVPDGAAEEATRQVVLA